MSVQGVLEIIAARLDNKAIEMHRGGQWYNWFGSPRELIRMLDAGDVFRVKRVPRTIYAETANNELNGRFWGDKNNALKNCPVDLLVEFVEVLK